MDLFSRATNTTKIHSPVKLAAKLLSFLSSFLLYRPSESLSFSLSLSRLTEFPLEIFLVGIWINLSKDSGGEAAWWLAREGGPRWGGGGKWRRGGAGSRGSEKSLKLLGRPYIINIRHERWRRQQQRQGGDGYGGGEGRRPPPGKGVEQKPELA